MDHRDNLSVGEYLISYKISKFHNNQIKLLSFNFRTFKKNCIGKKLLKFVEYC